MTICRYLFFIVMFPCYADTLCRIASPDDPWVSWRCGKVGLAAAAVSLGIWSVPLLCNLARWQWRRYKITRLHARWQRGRYDTICLHGVEYTNRIKEYYKDKMIFSHLQPLPLCLPSGATSINNDVLGVIKGYCDEKELDEYVQRDLDALKYKPIIPVGRAYLLGSLFEGLTMFGGTLLHAVTKGLAWYFLAVCVLSAPAHKAMQLLMVSYAESCAIRPCALYFGEEICARYCTKDKYVFIARPFLCTVYTSLCLMSMNPRAEAFLFS